MSLQFYLGRTGTGKTFQIVQEIRNKLLDAPLGSPLIYIVPDQMSFHAEQELLKQDKLKGMIRAQVYSFSRLAWKVFNETGGMVRQHLNKAGVHMMIRKIINEEQNQLQIFRKAADKNGFIDQVEQLLIEYKRYCIESATLQAVAENETTTSLKTKLHDISLIYQKFMDQIDRHYLDSEDYFRFLAEKIPQSNYLKEATIYIDGFHGFTPLELQVIEQLLLCCKKVVIALTTDQPYHQQKPQPYSLFRMTGETYYQIHKIATKQQITIEADVILEKSFRFIENTGLSHLEQQFTTRTATAFPGTPTATVLVANKRSSEVAHIAQEIIKLVRSGYRYRDIIILARNIDQYTNLIETIFSDYQIPIFIDQKRTMLNHPLIEFVRAAIESVETNFAIDPMFRTFKTDWFAEFLEKDFEEDGLDPSTTSKEIIIRYREDIAVLENYVLARGIRGSKWEEEWFYKQNRNLELVSRIQTNEELATQEKLNLLRLGLFTPLKFFSEKLKTAKTAQSYIEAIYWLLKELQIQEKIDWLIHTSEQKGDLIVAREHKQAWTGLIRLFDQFIEIFKNEEISLKTCKLTLESGLEALQYSLLPPAIDQITFGNLDVAKPQNIKVAFIIGLNEGVLPKRMSDDGLLTESDRAKLAIHDIHLAPSIETVLADEDFVAYMTFNLACDQIYFSYPIADDVGKTLLPSNYVKQLHDLFPKITEKFVTDDVQQISTADQINTVNHTNTTLGYLVKQIQCVKNNEDISDFWWDVYNEYMKDSPKKDAATFVLSSFFYRNQADKLSESTVAAMHGETIHGSVSQIELYNSCPFSYFTQYDLHLEKRQIYRFAAPELGTFFHESIKLIADSLEKNKLTWRELDVEKCEIFAENAVNQIAPLLQHEILFSTERMLFLKKKYTEIIKKTVTAMQLHADASGFSPFGFEVPFGTKDAQFPTLSVPIDYGKTIELRGRIDRVDILTNDLHNQAFFNVIDFKSGRRGLNFSEVYNGLTLQMLTYLQVMIANSMPVFHKEGIPAGVLYFHIHNPVLTEANSFLQGSEREKIWLKQYKMNGLLMNQLSILEQLDINLLNNQKSDIIPVALKKQNGFTSYSKVASPQEFQLLLKHIRKVYQASGKRILAGHVEISPYKYKKKHACSYCAFRPVCQFDPSLTENQYRNLPDLKKEEIIELIRTEVNDDSKLTTNI